MKKPFRALVLAGLAGFASLSGSVQALDRAELDQRIHALRGKFEQLQAKPDRAVPAATLAKARGIVLLDRTKAGFVFAFQGGGGVALVRDESADGWSPVAFLGANEASLGFQVGGQQSFVVILLMNTNATRLLTEPSFELGGEARGTAVNATAGAEGVVSSAPQSVLIFDDRKGLYGGAALKAGAIAPDDKANQAYYGEFVSMQQILFERKVEKTDAAKALARVLRPDEKRAGR